MANTPNSFIHNSKDSPTCHQFKAGEHKLLGGYGLFYSWNANFDFESEETR